MVAAFEPVDRRRLADVEGAKQHERGGLPGEIARHDGEHQQKGDDLIPHHRAMVGDPEMPAGDGAGPSANQE